MGVIRSGLGDGQAIKNKEWGTDAMGSCVRPSLATDLCVTSDQGWRRYTLIGASFKTEQTG